MNHMASWVAPSIAAEIWGVSIDHVLGGIADGSIPSFVDGEFLFVDMAGQGFPCSTPRSQPSDLAVTPDELRALTFEPIVPPDKTNSPVGDDEDDSSHDISHWRTSREQSSHVRRPPQSEAA
jgi:hypothetical protein